MMDYISLPVIILLIITYWWLGKVKHDSCEASSKDAVKVPAFIAYILCSFRKDHIISSQGTASQILVTFFLTTTFLYSIGKISTTELNMYLLPILLISVSLLFLWAVNRKM